MPVLRGQDVPRSRELTLDQARSVALAKHPRISVADLQLLAAREQVRENVAAYLPAVAITGGAVDTSESQGGVRAASSTLALSGIYNRVSASVTVSQLITDFGRTSNLTASSRLRAAAQEQNSLAARALVVLEVDNAFFAILQDQAVLKVVEQAVKTRTLLRNNTVALEKNQLKSALDVSFAEVNLKDAELLVSRSRNDLKSAYATLARLLLDPKGTTYQLHAPGRPPALSADSDALVEAALRDRPELESLRLETEAAQRFARAERALSRPSLSLQGTAGVMPYREQGLDQNYAAAGLIVNWPIFTGGYNQARQREAEFRAQAADEALMDLDAVIRRDVQLAYFNAGNALERASITSELRGQAEQAYSLANARYNAGSSSVIELSQAQLNLTTAEISETTTRYEYLLRRSILDFQSGALHASLRDVPPKAARTGK